MAENTEQLDTRIEIVTPENIAFHYRLAGPFRRLLAYLADLALRLIIVVAAGFAALLLGIAGLSGIAIGSFLILFFLLEWFYGGLFEALWNGQTPGKRLLGLRVITVEGQPLQGWQAILRNFLRAADAMPVIGAIPTYQVGFWSTLLSPRLQRLGDHASGTMVIVDEEATPVGIERITDPAALQLAAELPVNFRASRSLARALSLYVSRRKRFIPERRRGIAVRLAEPLREKLDLPSTVDSDLLLCAVYQHTFIASSPDEPIIVAEEAPPEQPLPASPFKTLDPNEVQLRL